VSERIQLERLSPLDASNLRVEDRGVPMHVAALVILDRTPLGSSRQDGLEALRVRRLPDAHGVTRIPHQPVRTDTRRSRAVCTSHLACARCSTGRALAWARPHGSITAASISGSTC
jgi:hypothetical protein